VLRDRGMRPELEAIVVGLFAQSETSRSLTLDQIGEALGITVASADDVDAMLTALEAKGLAIVSPETGDATGRLRRVLGAARDLHTRTGRRPTPAEIAEETAFPIGSVRAALLLGRVMGR